MVTLSQVLEETAFFQPEIAAAKLNSNSFVNVELFTEGRRDFKDDVLYIGFASAIHGQLERVEDMALLLIKDRGLSYNGVNSDRAIVVEYPHGTDIQQLFGTVRGIFNKKWTFLENSSRLLEAFTNSKNLDDLVEAAAHLVKNPLLVMDASYKVLTYSKSYKTGDLPWLQTIEKGYFTYEYIASIYRFNSSQNVPENNEPYYQKVDVSPYMRLISKIYHHGTFIGYLVTLETNTLFHEIDRDIYKLISNIFAKAIKSERDLQIHKGDEVYEFTLIDLIEGNFKNRNLLLRGIKNTRFEQSKLFQLVNIEIDNYSHKDATDDHLNHSLKSLFPNSWSFHYKKNILVLIGLKNEDVIPAQSFARLEKIIGENLLKAGISDIFDDLFDIASHYNQTCRALQLSRLVPSTGCIFEYDHLKFYDMVLSAGRTGDDKELRNFCSSKLLNLREYDANHATEYMKTLWTFLNSNKNLIITSQKLHIHKNTAAYRINKLRDLFSINFDDDFLLFRLYYSYMLLSAM